MLFESIVRGMKLYTSFKEFGFSLFKILKISSARVGSLLIFIAEFRVFLSRNLISLL